MAKNPDKPLSFAQARAKIAEAMNQLLSGNDPGTQSFHLKRPKRDYTLKLTKHQRDTLLTHTGIIGTLRKKIEEAGDGTQVITVTRKELDKLNDQLGSNILDARSPHKKRLSSVHRQVAEQFASDYQGLFSDQFSEAPPAVLYQFTITLLDVEPTIWRRIQVEDCTLDKLHEHIQTSMGWLNCHLHLFEVKGRRYGPPDQMDDGFDGPKTKDSTTTLISQVVPKGGKRFSFKYCYDFGDGWEHEVVFEGNPPADPKKKYPLCVEGERACPPEDCGGPFGYLDFLAAITDPDHEEHESVVEWIGGEFDPEQFSAKDATRAMRNG